MPALNLTAPCMIIPSEGFGTIVADRCQAMRKRKMKIVGGVSVLLLVAAIFYLGHENDPIYEGKRLSKHLEAFSENGLFFGGVGKEPGEPAEFNPPQIK